MKNLRCRSLVSRVGQSIVYVIVAWVLSSDPAVRARDLPPFRARLASAPTSASKSTTSSRQTGTPAPSTSPTEDTSSQHLSSSSRARRSSSLSIVRAATLSSTTAAPATRSTLRPISTPPPRSPLRTAGYCSATTRLRAPTGSTFPTFKTFACRTPISTGSKASTFMASGWLDRSSPARISRMAASGTWLGA